MNFPELPHYLTVKAVQVDDTVTIEVHSTVHVNRVVQLPTSYSLDYYRDSPTAVRIEVLTKVVAYYGLTFNGKYQ